MKMRQRSHDWQVAKRTESRVEFFFFFFVDKEYKKLLNLISRTAISLSLKILEAWRWAFFPHRRLVSHFYYLVYLSSYIFLSNPFSDTSMYILPLHWKNTVYIHKENKKKKTYNTTCRPWDSELYLVTTLWFWRSGVWILAEARGLSVVRNVSPGCMAHPSSYAVGTGLLLFIGGKRPGSELNTLPPSAEVKNEWSCTCSPPMRLPGVPETSIIFTCIILHVL